MMSVMLMLYTTVFSTKMNNAVGSKRDTKIEGPGWTQITENRSFGLSWARMTPRVMATRTDFD